MAEMDMKEKLVDLIASKECSYYSGVYEEWVEHDCEKCGSKNCSVIQLADHLITNGVEIPVHCCDCAKCITHIDDVGCSWLFCKRQKGNPMVDPTEFCSYGERRDND